MFNDLSEKFEKIFHKIRGYGKITEENIKDTIKEIKLALLAADVNYKVVKKLISDIKEKALGQEVIASITPGQAFIKIVHDELIKILGGENRQLNLGGTPPAVIMLCGLQGSGKTTFAGKLANFLRKKKKNPLLVAADIYRPAAIDQLKKIGAALNIPVYFEENKNPVEICKNSIDHATSKLHDIVILDTAGRLHIDEDMMKELEDIKNNVKPSETLLIVDAMIGQDAVNMAKEFNSRLEVSGIILTKLDGDTRGGAALSIVDITGKPIKFIGTGEKLSDIEEFYPDRLASRILGMGDIVSLVEKAQEVFDEKKAAELEKRIRKNQFTLEDFLDQLQQIKKMGPLKQIISMIPGVDSKMLKEANVDDKQLKHIEAIILSMTPEERRKPEILNGSRRKRIALGSGRPVSEINRLIKQFNTMKKMMKKFSKIDQKKIMSKF